MADDLDFRMPGEPSPLPEHRIPESLEARYLTEEATAHVRAVFLQRIERLRTELEAADAARLPEIQGQIRELRHQLRGLEPNVAKRQHRPRPNTPVNSDY